MKVRLWLLVCLLMCAGSVARAGSRPFEILFVNGSPTDATGRAARLFGLFRADIKKLFPKGNEEGVNLDVAEPVEAAKVFKRDCSGKIENPAEFRKLGTPWEYGYDDVIFYCYDEALGRVSFVVLDENGKDLGRVELQTYGGVSSDKGPSMTGMILKDARAIVVEFLLSTLSFNV